MIRYQKIDGLRLDNSTGLPAVVPTPEGRAMGAVPGWKMLLDPAYAYQNEALALNRAAPNSLAEIYAGSAIIGTFPGSAEPSFDASEQTVSFLGPVAWNPDAWTFFSIVRRVVHSDLGFFRRLAVPIDTSDLVGEISLNFGLEPSPIGTTFRIYERNNNGENEGVRLEYVSSESWVDRTLLIMCTFSTRSGLAIFENGELVAENRDDTRSLTKGYGFGEWRIWQNWRAHFGMVGLLDIDLSWPEHGGYRRAIEQFLITKYEIM